jgi:hypothetical protein
MTNVPAILQNSQLGIALALLLLALLAVREVARVSAGPRWKALARWLTVASIPILILFLMTAAIYIIQAFR